MAKKSPPTSRTRKGTTSLKYVHTPHDKFFKQSLKEIKIARDLFEAHLPPEVYSALDLETLQPSDKSYLTPKLEAFASDFVYRCQMKGRDGYIPILILSEHQSTDDPHMAFRMLQYTVCLMDDHLKTEKKKLPIVLPLCIYHGEESPYPHSCDIYDDFEDPELARALVFKPFKLVDLTTMSMDTIQKHKTASIMEALFKLGREKSPREMISALGQYPTIVLTIYSTSRGYFTSLGTYVLSQEHYTESSIDELLQELATILPKIKGKIMTFAKQLEQRGVQKGVQQGIQAGADQTNLRLILKMKAEHRTHREIADFLALSETEVVRLLEEVAH